MWKIQLAIIWGQWRHAQLIGLHWAILKHNHLLVLLFLSQVPQHPVCRDVQLERNLLHFVSVISVICALSSHLEYCRFCVTRLAPSCQKSKLILQFPVILGLIKSHPDSKSQRILPDLTIGAKKLSSIIFFVFRSECTNKGGTAAGSCASGFGVCCTCKFLLQKNFCSCISRINALICTLFKISHPRLRQHHLREHHLLPVVDVHRSRRPVRSHRLWMQHRCLPGLLSLNCQSLETVFWLPGPQVIFFLIASPGLQHLRHHWSEHHDRESRVACWRIVVTGGHCQG